MSIYFKVFSTTLLSTITLKINNYELERSLNPSPSFYSCGNNKINYLALYQLSFKNL